MFVASYRNTEIGARRIAAAMSRAQDEDEASRLKSQISQLETKLEHLHELEIAQKALRASIDAANSKLAVLHGNYVPLARIVRRIMRALDVSYEELLSNRRNKEIVFARQAIFYWARRRTRLSLPEIGRRMGGRDHTTVLHGSDVYPNKRLRMGRYLRPVR